MLKEIIEEKEEEITELVKQLSQMKTVTIGTVSWIFIQSLIPPCF